VSKHVTVVKGKVLVQDQFTSVEEALVRTKHRNKSVFEFWRTRHASLEFLSDFEKLEELSLINATIATPESLSKLRGLKKLFLNGAKFASGYGFLAHLDQIEELHLLNVRGAFTLPDLEPLASLRTFRVWGCKGFADASVLNAAPRLEELEFIDTALTPEALTALFEKESVKYLSARFGTKRENDAFSQLSTTYGKARYPGV
jgi:hypothetical protein